MKRKEWLLLSLVLVLLGAACAGLFWYRGANSPASQTSVPLKKEAQLAPGTPAVTLLITRDYGNQEILKKTVPQQQGDTVMDLLKRHGEEMKTNDNGSFVESIGGLASTYKPEDSTSKKLGWFFYVNGMMSDIGAGEYHLQAGDVITWDYHSWDFDTNTPAQIGVYPQPFVQHAPGKNTAIPLAIMYAPGFQAQAEQVARALSSLRNDETQPVPWDEKLFSGDKALLVIGDTHSYAASAFYKKLWQEKAMYGLYAHFTADGIEVLDTRGTVTHTYAGADAGALISTAHPASRRPLWFIGGNSQEGIKGIIRSLTTPSGIEPWKNAFGVLQNGSESVRLPILPSAGGTP